jgi:hypothetical protein
MQLELIKDEGWILRTDLELEKCSFCFKKLGSPFFFCRKTSKGFCRKCELGTAKVLCRTIQKEHEHLNIIRLEKK